MELSHTKPSKRTQHFDGRPFFKLHSLARVTTYSLLYILKAKVPFNRAVEVGEASASSLFSCGHTHMGSLLLDPSILLSSLPIWTW